MVDHCVVDSFWYAEERFAHFEMSDFQKEIKSLQEERSSQPGHSDRIGFGVQGEFDSDLYGQSDKSTYLESLPADEEEDEDDEMEMRHPSTRNRINPPQRLISDTMTSTDDGSMDSHYREQYGSGLVNTRISDRENEVNFKQSYIFIILTALCVLVSGEA